MFRFFRKTDPEKVRRAQYKRFGVLHELSEAEGYKENIREILNLQSVDLIRFIYHKKIKLEEAELDLFFLDYLKPGLKKSLAEKLSSVCLLSSWQHMDYNSLKISRKLPKVLESIGASASGGEVVSFGDEEFDSKVTVFARNINEARVLDKDMREIILNSLYNRNLNPELRIGSKFMLFENLATLDAPTDLTDLEKLMADLMSLYLRLSKNTSSDDKGDLRG